MGKNECLKSVINNRNSHVYIGRVVASWTCEVTEIVTQRALKKPLSCEDYSDLTSPTSKPNTKYRQSCFCCL